MNKHEMLNELVEIIIPRPSLYPLPKEFAFADNFLGRIICYAVGCGNTISESRQQLDKYIEGLQKVSDKMSVLSLENDIYDSQIQEGE